MESVTILITIIEIFIIISSSCNCELDCFNFMSEMFKKDYIEIHETVDAKTALAIYQHHGVGRNRNRNVCQSMDGGNTNRIFGEVVCKYAIEKLYPTSSLVKRVECERDIPVFELRYDHGEKPTEIKKYHRMAKCLYEENKWFYIINANKDNFYYVVQYEPTSEVEPAEVGMVKAVLNIKFDKKKEYKQPQAYQTTDSLEADDVFGVYGSNIGFVFKQYTHLCKGYFSGKFQLLRPDICQKAVQLKYMNGGNKVLLNKETKCVKKQIIRRLINVDTGEQVKTKSSYLMVTCSYLEGSKLYTFDVLNGPSDNSFYILEGYLKDAWVKALLKIK